MLNPNETKPFWQSRTVWGVVIMAAAGLIKPLGYELTPELQTALVDLVLNGVEIAGAALAIFGRVAASKNLG